MSVPSGPIQSFSAGFLSLLALKNKGVLPDTLLGNVQPVIEMAGFYLRGQVQNANVGFGRSLPANTYNTVVVLEDVAPFPQVPNNEYWFVEHASIRAQAGGAGATLDQFQLAYLFQNGTNPGYVFQERDSVTATKTAGVVSARDFWMPPGSILAMWVGVIGTNPVAFDALGFRYAPLRI